MNATAIRDALKKRGEELLAQPRQPTPFTGNSNADALLNDIEHYPHAFVTACLMDRQWQAEKCWSVPYRFKERLGSFEFGDLAALPQKKVASLFVQDPPLHRLKQKMADIFYSAVQKIGQEYSGKASLIWQGQPSSATIVRRFLEFNGAGPKIATMAANILVRDFKIPVSDKFSIDISPDVQVRRVLERLGLVREDASNEEIIYTARELNPPCPGIFDLAAWEIGREWCRPRSPDCKSCYMQQHCATATKRQSTPFRG
jgi:endonuclease III